MSLNWVVLIVNILGAVIALVALVPLHRVAALTHSPKLRRGWSGMSLIMVCCIALLFVASAASLGRTHDVFDLAATGIHILGPCFVPGVAWLSLLNARHLLRIEAFEEAAFVDPLTGLGNRRRLDACMADEIVRARQTGRPLSIVAIDIDHFKTVNDRFGHHVGDAVLKHIATLATSKSRRTDTVCRMGGEEFVVIMPGIEGAFAMAAAERLRGAIAAAGAALDGGGEVRATVSLGLATLRSGDSPEVLLRRADEALYDSKRGGRNRLTAAA